MNKYEKKLLILQQKAQNCITSKKAAKILKKEAKILKKMTKISEAMYRRTQGRKFPQVSSKKRNKEAITIKAQQGIKCD